MTNTIAPRSSSVATDYTYSDIRDIPIHPSGMTSAPNQNTAGTTPAGNPNPPPESNPSSSDTNPNSNSKQNIWSAILREKAFISTVSISIISFFIVLPLFLGSEFVANPLDFLTKHLSSKEFINNQFATAISFAISTSLIPPITYLAHKAIVLRRQYRTSLKQMLNKKVTDSSSRTGKVYETDKPGPSK